MDRPTFYEFFAGGGMARAGLGADWRCLFANDFDARKAAVYRENWGGDHFRLEDVHKLAAADLPGRADLAWASFPCQDLSLAGAGRGLAGARSGAFWGFHALLSGLAAVLALVTGTYLVLGAPAAENALVWALILFLVVSTLLFFAAKMIEWKDVLALLKAILGKML